jgi:hypothetical protein
MKYSALLSSFLSNISQSAGLEDIPAESAGAHVIDFREKLRDMRSARARFTSSVPINIKSLRAPLCFHFTVEVAMTLQMHKGHKTTNILRSKVCKL